MADDEKKPEPKAKKPMYSHESSKKASSDGKKSETKPAAKKLEGEHTGELENKPKVPEHKPIHERHHAEREELHKRHRTERRDLHGNHRTDHDQMHERHAADHDAMSERHLAEMAMPQPGAAPGAPGAAPGAAPAAPMASPGAPPAAAGVA